MTYLIELFGSIPFSTIIIFVAAVVFLISICIKGYKLIVEYHDNNQKKDDLLKNISKDLKEVIAEQQSMKNSIKDLKISQENVIKKQKEIDAKNKEIKINELKDKLLQNYRFYTDKNRNPLQAWSEMEKEAFRCVFRDYEKLGGNGHMHTHVEPEMKRLKVIPMSDATALEALAQSRKWG